jgi:hypothetical protein
VAPLPTNEAMKVEIEKLEKKLDILSSNHTHIFGRNIIASSIEGTN